MIVRVSPDASGCNSWLRIEVAIHRQPGLRIMTRILIADDHQVVRSGLRAILEAQPNWEVVAEAADGKEAILKAIETKPDVAVLDYSLPLVNGIEVTRQIRARLPRTEVLIFTMHDNETVIEELVRAGARGYLLKSDARRDLMAAIEALANHRPYFTARVSEALLKSFLTESNRTGSTLTNRERGVVQLIAEGHTNKSVANLLNISMKTVETHRATRHAQARSLIIRRSRALCDPQQARRGVNVRRLSEGRRGSGHRSTVTPAPGPSPRNRTNVRGRLANCRSISAGVLVPDHSPGSRERSASDREETGEALCEAAGMGEAPP